MDMKTQVRLNFLKEQQAAAEYDQRLSEMATLVCCGAQARKDQNGVWHARCTCTLEEITPNNQ